MSSSELLGIEREREIPDSFFDGTDEYFDVIERFGGFAFLPRSITIDRNVDDVSATATIRGILLGETEAEVKTRTLSCNQQIPRRYKRIYREGTTARGIGIGA